MDFVKIPIESVKEAEYNPRKKLTQNDKEYRELKKSITEFGYIDPIIVNADNTIIGGHQRYSVLKELGYKEVEAVRVNLSKEKEKALNIALNKIKGKWDSELLQNLLIDLDRSNFDLSLTGFDYSVLQSGIRGNAERTQKELVERIHNLEKAQFPGCGKYDIPEILPTHELPEIKEWIGFNYVLSDKNPEGKAVHFFVDDYQFERLWNTPDKYIDKLRQYECVASPDFSPYADMPLALQIFNHYRKHWLGRYWQEHGITVIPTIRASTDERSLDFFLDGEPSGGIVMLSTLWTTEDEEEEAKAFIEMVDNAISPIKYIFYGRKLSYMNDERFEFIPSFTMKRWGK